MVTAIAPRLLTEKEAAAYLGCSPGSLAVWRCTRRHNLPFVKIGRAVRYRVDHLDAFIASNTCLGTSQQGRGEVTSNV